MIWQISQASTLLWKPDPEMLHTLNRKGLRVELSISKDSVKGPVDFFSPASNEKQGLNLTLGSESNA